jgi:hypothetical protein
MDNWHILPGNIQFLIGPKIVQIHSFCKRVPHAGQGGKSIAQTVYSQMDAGYNQIRVS